MAWTYASWRAAGARGSDARITALENHMDEVSEKIDAALSADGKSRATDTLVSYLDQLGRNLDSERSHPNQRTNGGIGRVRFGKPT